MDALDLYESFHLIQRQTTWGDFPWGCICLRYQKWTLCEHTSLVASLFLPYLVVPDKLVAETPALSKKCNKLRGTAGPRRARIIKEIAKEKKQGTSKLCRCPRASTARPSTAGPRAIQVYSGRVTAACGALQSALSQPAYTYIIER